ncbi:PilW family protein [Noviherbaspirillum sp.]|jgi:type IV pilus assembly protein PilW|uniref:PilW family protein n=1 Tax=Noviherbaspirillum sp. TaxID=1926288 RepID=UPI0025ED8ED9|nr:PilW family protein [Noviherbaspirillum sp.]
MKRSLNLYHKGFSLVEIMVGLAMGMIAMVVIMQVFAVFEGGKRSTTGGADAQTNGAVALYMIERDLRIAGWGMESKVYSDCTTTYAYCDGSASCGGVVGALGNLKTAVAIITDGGSGPDTITAQYFTNPNDANFRFPGSTLLNTAMTLTTDKLNVMSLSGCKAGDLMLVKEPDGGKCTLMKITTMSHDDTTGLRLPHESTPAGEYNPPLDYMTTNNWPVYANNSSVTCFSGSSTGGFIQHSYSINANHQLVREDNKAIAPEIFDLQARYGISVPGSEDLDWVDATGPTWANPTPADIKRIKALRIALLARSTQHEKPESGSCSTTTTDMAAKWSSWAVFNTAGYPEGWQCYRYKAYETIVPLRNIIMGES